MARHTRAWLAGLAGLVAVGACAEPTASRRQAVVYGEDGRTEPHAHPNAALRAVADSSVAVQMDPGWLDTEDPSDVRVTYTRTLGEAKSLCAGEPFADQIEPGTCSGTLIDERHLLTAGHCVDTPSDCADDVWVFGLRYAPDGTLETLTTDDVYACARVLAYHDDGDVDHAVVELDRPVVGHLPATLRVEPAALPEGTPLALIGHPNGIPMKIDSGGVVTWSDAEATYLTATLDAFDGNSGSGVFDHDGDLVALLRGGETDYVDAGGCNVVHVIDPPPAQDGESLTYLRPAIEAFCRVPGVESPVCGCDGPCVQAPPGDTCAAPEELAPVSQTVNDTLVGFAPNTRGSCGGSGPERVYRLTLASTVLFSARTRGFDSVLYLRGACEGEAEELACHDDVDQDTDRGSHLEGLLDPGTYHLFVDAYDGEAGAFELTLTFVDPDAADAGLPAADAAAPPADGGLAADAGGRTVPPGVGCSCRATGPSGRPSGRPSARPSAGSWRAAALAMLALGVMGRTRRRWRPRRRRRGRSA